MIAAKSGDYPGREWSGRPFPRWLRQAGAALICLIALFGELDAGDAAPVFDGHEKAKPRVVRTLKGVFVGDFAPYADGQFPGVDVGDLLVGNPTPRVRRAQRYFGVGSDCSSRKSEVAPRLRERPLVRIGEEISGDPLLHLVSGGLASVPNSEPNRYAVRIAELRRNIWFPAYENISSKLRARSDVLLPGNPCEGGRNGDEKYSSNSRERPIVLIEERALTPQEHSKLGSANDRLVEVAYFAVAFVIAVAIFALLIGG